MNRAAVWLCNANAHVNGKGGGQEGYSAVTKRALKWKTGFGSAEDPVWVSTIYVRIAVMFIKFSG